MRGAPIYALKMLPLLLPAPFFPALYPTKAMLSSLEHQDYSQATGY